MNNPGRKVITVRTSYYNKGVLRVYETRSETPMHESIRERFPARTAFIASFPEVKDWPFGLYQEIERYIVGEGWEAARKAAKNAKRKARIARG